VLLRLVGKWLNAGVLEDGVVGAQEARKSGEDRGLPPDLFTN
jgi:hypothetical protein